MTPNPNLASASRFGALAALVALLAPSSALASGAVVTGPSGGAAGLARLVDLDVSVAMDDLGSEVDETRLYASPPGLTESGFELVVHRSLLGPEGAEATHVFVGGEPWGALLLPPGEADLRRLELVKALGHPAPLRDLGTPMLVLQPIEIAAGGAVPPIRILTTVPHEARGTMFGLSIAAEWQEEPVAHATLAVDALTEAPLRALYAPYDTLSTKRDGSRHLAGAASTWERATSFEWEVLLSTGDEPVRLDVLPFRYSEEDGGFLMALLSASPEPAEEDVVPRDIVVCLDRSGSMKGDKLDQAKAALAGVLDGLRPQDRIALVAYNGKVATFRDEAVPATPENLADAKAFVSDLVADAGTNIGGALEAAFAALPLTPGHPRYVVLLTDGLPTEGPTGTEEILDIARAKVELGARIFTFGVGWDVNTVLLDQLAKESGGEAIYVTPGQSVALSIAAFFERIAAPMVTSPVLDLAAFGAADAYPAVLPDLYAGETATVLARFAKPGTGVAVLSGERDGAKETHFYELTLPELALEEGFVPRLWATRHVGHVLHDVKLGLAGDEVLPEVLALAERFGVVTDFTYFQTDEAGDSVMSYSEVPRDAAGSVAVSTSASLDAESRAGSMDAGEEAPGVRVRYVWDRTLPFAGGAYHDTSLPAEPDWVDLHFGSERFFTFLETDRDLDVQAFLSVSPAVRFEHFGRHFRVSDPAAPPEGGLPVESAAVPPALVLPAETLVAVGYLGDSPPAGIEVPDLEVFETPDTRPAGGCGAGAASGDLPFGLVLLLALGLLAVCVVKNATRCRES